MSTSTRVMHVDQWTDRLSECLDGDLDLTARAALDAHLATCRECSAELDGLRLVVGQADNLPDRPPERDLWPAIEARLVPRRGVLSERTARRWDWLRVRWSFSTPQLVAATVLLAALAGLIGSLAKDRVNAPHASGAGASEPTEFVQAARPVTFVDPKYDQAVADLLDIVHREGDRLDPRTIAAITRSLASIDRAIGDARTALLSDPASAYLSRHLADARRKKLEVLRVAVDLTTKGS